MKDKFKLTRLACYYSYLSMSSIFCVPSLLFVTFNNKYNISFALLGTLVVVNFITQLGIDLVFTFFSKYFNPKKIVKIMPLNTSFGLFVYAILPSLMPNHAFLGLAIGTFIFSVSAGLSEVLMSPIIAAIPSEHPDRDMSRLHSLYAWGVVMNVLISTVYLRIFGTENWMYLVMFLAILPIGASILFSISPLPDLTFGQNQSESPVKRQPKGLVLCFLCIFLGSATENLMTNWISSFMETGLSIPKEWCDIAGIAVFALLLGLVRIVYAKYGKNIINIILIGMIGSIFCYIISGVASNAFVATVACILTGAFTSMLWPGTLIMMEENMPALGVAAYALMAAGGDFGAGVSPQLMGIITDAIAVSDWAEKIGTAYGYTAEQVAFKSGMVIGAIFPILGTILVIYIKKYFKKERKL